MEQKGVKTFDCASHRPYGFPSQSILLLFISAYLSLVVQHCSTAPMLICMFLVQATNPEFRILATIFHQKV